jgi:hypothetical protein
MPNEQDKAADELVTVAGGVEMMVHYQNNGASETVKVRQIPISKVQDFLLGMANEALAVELYCDKPKGWADTLTLESASAIADKGQELNRPFFQAWGRRQAIWRKMQEAWTGGVDEPKPRTESRLANSPPASPTTTT